ncbi:DUF4224 domain-containing protein [Marinobacter sp. 71-i]|uniref:DUF4224 domain-containing protein n=1 Tax=Marinobacter iranensis TaxID=2962607 RepID=A0ABT5Y9J3_9GAMM|nr:DUF4224 domain-containing protein [Marinobacter iranensis]MDF0750347.1 DUF4224 domain-containing protein [Marinobacter iranensis]
MMFLTQDEVAVLTGKTRKTSQKQVLEAAGIHYIENGIGELVVSRAHVERMLDGKSQEASPAGPNFASLLRKAS